MSPLLFKCVVDKILKEARETLCGGLHIQNTTEGGVFLSYRWGMSISGGKTKLLAIGQQQPGEQTPITVKGQALEEIKSFSHLSSEVQKDGKMEKEGCKKQGPSTKCGDGNYLEATF